MSNKQRLLIALFFVLGGTFLLAAGYLIWQNQQATGANDLANYQDEAPPAGLRITVRESGLTRITAAELSQARLDEVDLALSVGTTAVPYFRQNGDLYFYAHHSSDTLDAPQVYWLEPGAGQPMTSEAAAADGPGRTRGTIHYRWEENEIFIAFAESDDAWFGRRLFAPGPLSETEMSLPELPAAQGIGELRLRVWSNNADSVNPDHHLQAIINDNVVLDHTWDGKALEVAAGTIPTDTLRAEENSLRLLAPGDTGAAGEDLYIDWIEIDFEGRLNLGARPLEFSSDAPTITIGDVAPDILLLDITDAERPIRLTQLQFSDSDVHFAATATDPRRYVVARPAQVLRPELTIARPWDSLQDPARGADYIAIVPDDPAFARAAQPLLNYREDSGLAVDIIPTSHIFNEFGAGRASAGAIRDFLTYAAANWDPAPRFVLLVGDASYDTHNFSDGRNQNLIPTYHIFTQYAGYVASDTWLTMPRDDDQTPQIAIGRLPAQTPAQVSTMVDKILAYETSTLNEWQGRALLVADDEEQFDEVTSDLASNLNDIGFITNQLHMTENEDIRADILSDINQGVGLINYVGHGSVQVWGDERVFQAADASELENESRYPIFITFTCLNGYFNHPEVDALAETLLWREQGGIVAAIAPSGRSLTSQQTPIADVFYEILLQSDGATLGEALLSAKQSGADNDYLHDVIHTFNLLGDPALRFQRPAAE